jgi:hypothetical protein
MISEDRTRMYDRILLYNTSYPNRNTKCLESLQSEEGGEEGRE